LVTILLAPAASAQSAWREARSPHFVIYSQGSERELVEASRQMEATHWLLSILTEADTRRSSENGLPIVPVQVYLLRNIEAVQSTLHRSDNVAGIYYARLEGPTIIAPRNEGDFSMIALRHEYAHHFMLQYMPGSYPRWYVEGFAEVMGSSAINQQNVIAFGTPPEGRAYELRELPWTPIPRMFARPTSDNPRLGTASYGQYWLATHYMMFAGNRGQQLSDYFNALNRGASEEEAARSLGQTLAELDSEMRAYLRRNRFSGQRITIPARTLAVPTIRLLSEAESDALPLEMEAGNEPDRAGLAALARRTANAVRRFPAEPRLVRLNAQVQLASGAWEAAISAADATLALVPDDPRALVYKGLAMLHRAAADGPVSDEAFRTARQQIIRANRAAPDDQLPLAANFLSHLIAGRTPSPIAVDGLAKAILLLPQDDSLRMMLAMEQIRRRQLPQARSLLLPLAYSPHASDASEHALRIINWIDAGGEGSPPTVVEVDV
jgi:hypothetical protein